MKNTCIFLLCGLIIYSQLVITQNVYSQDTIQESTPKKLTVPIIATLGAGLLLQITGTILGLEANRHYVKASNAKVNAVQATSGSTEKASYNSQYAESQTQYHTYMYTGIGMLSAGTALSLTGIVLSILQLYRDFKPRNFKEQQDNINPTLFLGQRKMVYVFANSNQIGIGSTQ